jgi:hypothetical protein
MTEPAKAQAKKAQMNWLLWWVVTPEELELQVSKYAELKIWQSARGISLLLFLASAVLTAVLIELVTHDRTGYLDAAVFIVIGVLIYLGQRWAMILGMVLWTLEKGFQLVQMTQSGKAYLLVSIIVFWAVFMHAMWLAFRTEQARRKKPAGEAAA